MTPRYAVLIGQLQQFLQDIETFCEFLKSVSSE